jgi:hypothetical protein
MTKLIVATATHLLAYDTESEELELLLANGTTLSGVSWPSSGAELVSTHSHRVALGAGPGVDGTTGLGHLRVGFRTGPETLVEPVAVQCIGPSHIVVADRGRRCLVVTDPRTLEGTEHRYDVDGAEVSPVSVAFAHGRLWVLAETASSPSTVLSLEWPSMRLLSTTPGPARGMNDLWAVSPDEIVSCDTRGGKLVDLSSGATLFHDRTGARLRGLAATDSQVFVGRSDSTSGVWVLSRKGWKAERCIDLGALGEVRSIRVADEADRVHGSSALRWSTALSGARAHRVDTARRLLKMQTSLERRALLDGADWTTDLGVVAGDEDGIWRNGSSGVGISTRREGDQSDGEVRLRLVIEDPKSTGSVSAVARYRGPGDTCMIAGLARLENDQLILGLYESRVREAGGEAVWIERAHYIYALGMGETGFEIGLRVVGPVATMTLEGDPVITGQLMDTYEAGRFGVRIVGTGLAVRELVALTGASLRGS